MKKVSLLLIFLTLNVFAQSNEKVLIVSLTFDNGQMDFENAFTQEGVYASEMNKGTVSGKIYSVEGDEVFSFNFDLDNKLVIEEVGVIEETEFTQVLVLPHYENAEKIVFFNEETGQELVASIAFLSNLCGNGTCNPSEAFGNCPQDCPSGGEDSYCDREKDNICDADCELKFFDSDCIDQTVGRLSEQEIDEIVKQKTRQTQTGAESFPTEISEFVIVAIVILIILGFVFIRKKRSD